MEAHDELGPIDIVVIAYPADAPMTGEAAPLLVDLVERGVIRVLDVMFVTKNEDGTFSSDQTVSGLPDTIRLRLRPDAVFEGRVQGDPRLGPCRDFGGAFDFTATRVPG